LAPTFLSITNRQVFIQGFKGRHDRVDVVQRSRSRTRGRAHSTPEIVVTEQSIERAGKRLIVT
jgi:hypothetical protein